MWGHNEKMTICKPRRGLWRKQACWHLDLRLLVSGFMRNSIPVFSASKPMAFCYGSPSKLIEHPFLLFVLVLRDSSCCIMSCPMERIMWQETCSMANSQWILETYQQPSARAWNQQPTSTPPTQILRGLQPRLILWFQPVRVPEPVACS